MGGCTRKTRQWQRRWKRWRERRPPALDEQRILVPPLCAHSLYLAPRLSKAAAIRTYVFSSLAYKKKRSHELVNCFLSHLQGLARDNGQWTL